MNLYYFYILFIGVLIFWVFQDPNVPRYIELRIQLLRIDIARWFMMRKLKGQLMDYEKEAKKIMKERMKNNGEDKM